ncbi:MAG: 50S ribosomal protein L30 [Anaeromicrobium sp.]|uniref:50S ribosomal protein L30 n=1 Tax=Anaeromicrobium sp. TaxID=1929132 RepID=UPI0025ED6D2C|nr:50S ribosomal protein L30 [Anaeromicrobium sp.]MCT4594509.1 50S ribosomal protein L30 [Anaeromicrobium sp.]
MAKMLKITLVKSTIGSKPQHRKNIEALGLKKLHQTVEKPDNPQMRGMIAKVDHLVKVEEI